LNKLCVSLAVLVVLMLGLIVGGLALLMRGGISARVEPTAIEAAVAGKLQRMGIPGSFAKLRNPVTSSKQVLTAGRAHFADHCAICHGNDGSGQTEIGRNLYPRTPDLRLSETQQLTDGEIFYIIENGVRLTGMPAWGDGSEESKRATWHLVTFIRHLPQLTPEEKLEMERLNPKSPDEWREMQEDEKFLEATRPSGQEKQSHHH
jgi:mono/diheme cytochrome c family protein